MVNKVLLPALALLALIGMAVSLVLRARELRVSRKLAVRSIHTGLLKMAMDNPEYMHTWGPYEFADDEQERRVVYANLIVSFWSMAYELGDMTEIALRPAASTFFAGEQGRQFWQVARGKRLSASTRRRSRRFHQILDEEYQKATQPPSVPDAAPAPPETGIIPVTG